MGTAPAPSHWLSGEVFFLAFEQVAAHQDEFSVRMSSGSMIEPDIEARVSMARVRVWVRIRVSIWGDMPPKRVPCC